MSKDDFLPPDFLSGDENKNESQPPDEMPAGIVFMIPAGPTPVPVGGEPSFIEPLSENELIGLYVTTNAMLNLLIQKRILTEREVSQMIKKVKDDFKNNR